MRSKLFYNEQVFHKGSAANLPTWFMSALRDERDQWMTHMLCAPKDELESARSVAYAYEELINVLENGVPAHATVAWTSGLPTGA